MAVFGRRGYFSRYGRRVGSRYGYRSSSLKRRARGNMRAATQQRDSTEVVINRVLPLAIQFPQGADVGGSTVNIWQELRNSSFYSNYAPMYDQVKLCGVRAKINGSVQGNNQNAYLTPTIITAWDRNGITGVSNAANISTYSSAISKPWSLGNSFVQSRSIYASTMSEKSQYVSPQSLDLPSTDVNNPANPSQIQAIPFKPQLLIQVSLPIGAGLGGQTLGFTVELDIICKFRGLRKGAQTTDPTQVGYIYPPIIVSGLVTSSNIPIAFSSFTTVAVNSQIPLPNNTTLIRYNPATNVREVDIFTNTSTVTNISVPAGGSYILLPFDNYPLETIYYLLTNNGQPLPGTIDNVTTNASQARLLIPPTGYSLVGFPPAPTPPTG